jgi:NAD(P)-dependent dehydrogenase (short-subunit alcohol dehydrogenase family)
MGHFEWGTPGDVDAPTAVLLPGGLYSVQGPLLYWCAELLVQRGWRVIAVVWSPEASSAAQPRHHVEAELEAVAAALGRPPDLLVAKSLGSHALPWSIGQGVPGVWLTPVLTDTVVKDALARAGASHLAVGGSVDPMWAPAATLTTRAAVMSIDGADHSILIPSDWEESMRTHQALMIAIAAHIDGAR